MTDLSLNHNFLKQVFDRPFQIDLAELRSLDPELTSSLEKLTQTNIDELGIDFTLPGYDHVLKVIPV